MIITKNKQKFLKLLRLLRVRIKFIQQYLKYYFYSYFILEKLILLFYNKIYYSLHFSTQHNKNWLLFWNYKFSYFFKNIYYDQFKIGYVKYYKKLQFINKISTFRLKNIKKIFTDYLKLNKLSIFKPNLLYKIMRKRVFIIINTLRKSKKKKPSKINALNQLIKTLQTNIANWIKGRCYLMQSKFFEFFRIHLWFWDTCVPEHHYWLNTYKYFITRKGKNNLNFDQITKIQEKNKIWRLKCFKIFLQFYNKEIYRYINNISKFPWLFNDHGLSNLRLIWMSHFRKSQPAQIHHEVSRWDNLRKSLINKYYLVLRQFSRTIRLLKRKERIDRANWLLKRKSLKRKKIKVYKPPFKGYVSLFNPADKPYKTFKRQFFNIKERYKLLYKYWGTPEKSECWLYIIGPFFFWLIFFFHKFFIFYLKTLLIYD